MAALSLAVLNKETGNTNFLWLGFSALDWMRTMEGMWYDAESELENI
jgi:hypothetical protein